jgi:hypothetical protein
MDPNGALAMRSKDFGAFSGKRVLQFYARTDQGVPDLHINLSGSKVGGPGLRAALGCCAGLTRSAGALGWAAIWLPAAEISEPWLTHAPFCRLAAAPQGSCRPTSLMGLKSTGAFGTFSRYDVPLAAFSSDSPGIVSSTSDFDGCGGNGFWDVNTIEFRNFKNWKVYTCVDNVMLYY